MLFNVRAFALTFALWWGVAVFLGTWWAIFRDTGSPGMDFLISLYPGYSVTPIGSLIGLFWGLMDGLFGGAIFAWLYNFIVAKLPAKP